MYKKVLVISTGSIEQSKKWVLELIRKQTKDSNGCWGNYHFFCDPNAGDFDAVVKLYRITEDFHINCNPKNIIALHGEPYLGVTYWHDWMVQGNEECRNIISSYNGDKNGEKQIVSQSCLPWFVEKTYTELQSMDIPEKTIESTVSWMTSNDIALPHHWYRMYFKAYVDKYNSELFDISGRGIKNVDTKWETIAPYQYTMAVENNCVPHAWTEKLSDAYIGYTLPFYHGSPNISDYFPEDSYIPIDIRNPEETVEIIERTIRDKEWEKRLPAIKEARRLVLEEYQFMPYLANFLDKTFVDAEYESVLIKKYYRSFDVRMKELLGRRVRNISKRYWRLKCRIL